MCKMYGQSGCKAGVASCLRQARLAKGLSRHSDCLDLVIILYKHPGFSYGVVASEPVR